MSVLPTIDRMVIREVVPPTVLGFIVYTFLVVMRGIFGLIEQVLVRGVSVADAGLVMLATLPHIAVLTIPMSFLFGVLLAVGRMNADNELVALQAGGIPVKRLLRAILGLGLLLTLVNGYLYVHVIPRSARELRDLKVRILADAKNLGRIDPGVFHEELPNALLYIRDIDEQGEWSQILFYDSSNPAEERLTLAQRGRLVTADPGPAASADPTSGDLPEVEQWLRLEDVVTHQFFRNDPETYRVSRNRTQLIRPAFDGRSSVRYRLAMTERSTPQLWNIARGADNPTVDPDDPRPTPEEAAATRRLAAVELNQRLAIPFACAVFGLLGLPLGVGSRSGSRGRGFVVSVGVVLVYYLISSQGRVLAIEGRLPPTLGIWLPNLVLAAAGLFLMRKMGRWLGEREKGESWIVRGLRSWKSWQHRRRVRRARGAADRPLTGSIPIEIQRRRYATRFPALFDRYVIRRLIPPLLLVLSSTAAIYILIDITDRIDNMVRHQIPLDVIVTYYVNLMPQVLLDVTPFALMITALILLSVMERQQELTALKAAGISLFRLTVPILLLAAVCAIGLWLLGDIVAPQANREAQRLRDFINGHDRSRSYRASDRQWLMSRDDESLYNFLRFDAPANTLVRFSLFRIDDDMNLNFHLFTRRARWNGGFWVADSGWFRQIYPDGTDEYRRIRTPMRLDIDEGPEYFGQEIRRPAEMSITELASYIEELEESGYQPSKLIVQWHQKLTYPLSAFVMVLLALPFGLGRGGRRVTTMHGIALALGLGIGYVILVAVFGELGEINIVPPFLGAWAPFVLAILFAVNRLTSLRT
jgi:LPS export ABC transporter permease LptG/LPS export ABC transporter permease LptF